MHAGRVQSAEASRFDAPEHAAGAGAIHLCRFVEVAGDCLEPGQQDQRVESHMRPSGDADRRREGSDAVVEPDLRLEPEVHHDEVEEPLPLEDPAPDQAHDDGGQQHREEKHRPETFCDSKRGRCCSNPSEFAE